MQTLRRTRAPRWVTNVCIQVAGVVQVRVNWFETMLWYGQLILAGPLYLGIAGALLIEMHLQKTLLLLGHMMGVQ